MDERIMIPCEGGGHPGHVFASEVMCSMCGSYLTPLEGETVPSHQRDDILARIERGDFDA